MISQENKKITILCILEILKDYSDEKHLLSQNEIVKKLNSIYDVKVERKSVGANIDSLIDFGYDIIKTKAGCYLAGRELEPSEIQFLVDAVFSSKSMSSKRARDLAFKLSKFLSIYEQRKYKYVYKTDELNRANNKQLFYTIDVINKAIEENKQIEFNYNYYDENFNLKTRRSGKPYLVNPYFMVNNLGRYYLVCNLDFFNDIANYKIDLITDIKIVDNSKIKSPTLLNGYENGLDISEYINSNIYMFGRNNIKATIKLGTEDRINIIADWFGKSAKVFKKGNDYYASITADEMSIIYWCLQYGEYVELIEPFETRQKIKENLKNLMNKYDK